MKCFTSLATRENSKVIIKTILVKKESNFEGQLAYNIVSSVENKFTN